jgi:hypothetical protein
MRTFTPRISIRLVFCVLSLAGVASCQRSSASSGTATSSAAAAEPHYVPDATIKDLMQSVVDTSADVVWLSVTTEVNEKGVIDTRPVNDEEWNRVRHGAVTLAEAANLLMIPGRHVARPGERSETPGIELEPE